MTIAPKGVFSLDYNQATSRFVDFLRDFTERSRASPGREWLAKGNRAERSWRR
jgi:hypothetical protein